MYRDTNGVSPIVNRRDTILKSQPPNGDLYVPTHIPTFQRGEIESLRGASFPEVSYVVMRKFLEGKQLSCLDPY